MPTLDERIEAAARAMFGVVAMKDWALAHPQQADLYREAARAALASTHPEDFIEPPEPIIAAVFNEEVGFVFSRDNEPTARRPWWQFWRRDSYLSEKS